MKRIYLHIILASILFSCGEKNHEQIEEDTPEKEVKESFDQRVKRHIEGKLSIPATEKYTYTIYKEDLDGDEFEDAVITVNRLEFAMDEANKSGETAKRAELGFMGNYNYIFYFDGKLDQISPQIAIPSSPQTPLKVSFEHVQSEAYKDILVDFRIRNSSYKDYYTVANHTPRRIFQWKNYDGLNTASTEAYYFKYDIGTMSLSKDILVMKANLEDPGKEIDIYTYEPQLKKTEELVYRFFYHPSQGKYVTKKQ